MTDIVNTARVAELQRLQDARDQLSDQIQALDEEIRQWPFKYPPHLETDQTRTEYAAKVALRKELQDAMDANVAAARAVEAQPQSEDALLTLLKHLRPVLRSYEGAEGEDVATAMAEIGRVYRALAGEP